jgi:hypothetical protein
MVEDWARRKVVGKAEWWDVVRVESWANSWAAQWGWNWAEWWAAS